MILTLFKESLWQQFGAGINMLRNAITMWPDEKWEHPRKFFDMAYHTLFFLDYYLTNPPEGFNPPLPFTLLSEMPQDRIDDIMPDRVYTKQEMLDYADACRKKCYAVIDGLTEENIQARWIEPDGSRNLLMIEMVMLNMRHVQHHAAQMNMMLRNEIGDAPGWISRAN
ncbi:DinB family protein [Chryseolinea sp. T2]|uniref:DinB family protein n=1 Tax=Chryseolinea sp. T2 TaxID=3129255 RepID=UPI003077C15E